VLRYTEAAEERVADECREALCKGRKACSATDDGRKDWLRLALRGLLDARGHSRRQPLTQTLSA